MGILFTFVIWLQVAGMFFRASMYTVFLKDWLALFDRDQFLVLRAEDYYSDMTGTLATAFEFLGVRKQNNLPAYLHKDVFNAAETRGGNTLPMLRDTRRILDRIFQPMKRELAELLKDDKFMWNDFQD